MKKTIKKLFMMAVIAVGVLAANVTAYADSGKTTIAVSSDTINIGDKVTVTGKAKTSSGGTAYATMTLSYDSSVLELVSCSTTYGGGGGTVSVSVDTFTVTFKAIAAGKAKFSLSATDGVDFSSGEELDSVEGSGTSITVKNEASDSSDNSSGSNNSNDSSTGTSSEASSEDANKKKSADNSLKTLTISPGTLSPTFKGSTTKYTATVANDVTNIAVSAIPVNANATVESVTGNTNLSVGTNQIQIVVKAENGTTATYKIDVTREAEAAAVVEPTTSEELESEETESEETESTEEETTTQPTFSISESSYVTAALPPEGMTLPATYTQAELTLADGNIITAFAEPVEEGASVEFYIFYGVNAAGTGNWYRYDTIEGTYQRATIISSEEVEDVSDMEYLQNSYNTLLEKYKKEKSFIRNAIAVMVFLGAVLVIVIVNMALYIRRVKLDEDEDDFDDFEERESSAEAVRRAYREQKAAERAKVAERAKAAERVRKAGNTLRAREIEREERVADAEREEALARAKAARLAEAAERERRAEQETKRERMAAKRAQAEEKERKSFFEGRMSGFINDDLDDVDDELEDNTFGWKKRSWSSEDDSFEERPVEKKKEVKKKTSSERVEVEDFNDF